MKLSRLVHYILNIYTKYMCKHYHLIFSMYPFFPQPTIASQFRITFLEPYETGGSEPDAYPLQPVSKVSLSTSRIVLTSLFQICFMSHIDKWCPLLPFLVLLQCCRCIVVKSFFMFCKQKKLEARDITLLGLTSSCV